MTTDIVRLYKAMLKRTLQQAAMPSRRENSLQAVFTSLGITRVVRGARALYGPSGGWHACFLALAYGEAGELERIIANPRVTSREVSRIFEISDEDVKTLIHHFDLNPKQFTIELVQWLRGQGADATTVLALAACERETQRRWLSSERRTEAMQLSNDKSRQGPSLPAIEPRVPS